MPKTWQPNKAKQFSNQVQLGRPYYVVYKIAQNMAPYEDSHLYSEIIFDRHAPITGTPMSGSLSAVALCQRFGPVHEEPPTGLRNIAGPGPQVGAPLGSNDYRGYLDEAELRGLEKHVRNGSDPTTRRR
ncbi:hypothetical protein [Streptomyces sp.]|uniref:hypothetical protein n=1 Tax=Streptomyces sp. TaxID=1931 RepID=UPI002F93EA7F